jgi:hypothetical protein
VPYDPALDPSLNTMSETDLLVDRYEDDPYAPQPERLHPASSSSSPAAINITSTPEVSSKPRPSSADPVLKACTAKQPKTSGKIKGKGQPIVQAVFPECARSEPVKTAPAQMRWCTDTKKLIQVEPDSLEPGPTAIDLKLQATISGNRHRALQIRKHQLEDKSRALKASQAAKRPRLHDPPSASDGSSLEADQAKYDMGKKRLAALKRHRDKLHGIVETRGVDSNSEDDARWVPAPKVQSRSSLRATLPTEQQKKEEADRCIQDAERDLLRARKALEAHGNSRTPPELACKAARNDGTRTSVHPWPPLCLGS